MTHSTRDYLYPILWCLAMAAALAALFAAATCHGAEPWQPSLISAATPVYTGGTCCPNTPSLISQSTASPAPIKGVGKQESAQPVAVKDGQSAALTLSDKPAGVKESAETKSEPKASAAGSLKASDTAAPVDPIDALYAAAKAADAALVAAASEETAKAQAHTDATAAAKLAQQRDDEANAAFMVEWNARHKPPTPPGPPGPILPVVSILAVTDTASCPPCRAWQPELDELRASGIPIKFVKDAPGMAVSATPTLILLVDDKEPGDATSRASTRIVGFDPQLNSKGQPVLVNGHQVSVNDVRAWYNANVKVFVHPPKSKESNQ